MAKSKFTNKNLERLVDEITETYKGDSGISGGANVWAAVRLSHRPENEGKTIVTFICDTGERYISTELFSSLPEPEKA